MIAQYGAISTHAISSGGNSTETFSHTVSAGSNRLLLVGTSNDLSTAHVVSSVAFNGVALTNIISSGDSNKLVELWGLVAPVVQTANIVITYDGAVKGGSWAITYSGIDQTP